ncbi:unnamed protein product [Dibothriocephalus latus]|uniref:VHS domain-containing protein n=1 Tax=Dibothriocephalus latus TaxID=60516 RepID=A0A3P7NJA9_DIBLA|nr:unnamed protein product [Dibothriocephalus latus]
MEALILVANIHLYENTSASTKDGALQDENPDRLLWFARIRDYMLQAVSHDIRQSIELIINCFKEEGSKDQRMAHWLLNILQMCAVHCTDKFIVTLNDQAVLSPFRKVLTDQSYSTQCDGVVRLKLFTLLKAWHEQYKEFFPESAFKKIYEDVYYGGEQSVLQPVNLHWFPNRTIVNEALDSTPYDLVRVGKELLSCGNKSFYHLNFLCAYPEHSSINRVQRVLFEGNLQRIGHAFQAEPQDLVNEASMTLMRMEVDVRFWEDIMQHAKIPKESYQAIATIGDDLRKLKSDVEQIFQNLNTTDSFSSRSSEQGYGVHVEALSQASHDLRTGENRNSELQFGRPTTSSLSSRPGEQGYGMHGSHDLRTGENRSSELQSGWRSLTLTGNTSDLCFLTADSLSSRPGDQGYDMPTKALTQPSDDLRTRQKKSSENQSEQPLTNFCLSVCRRPTTMLRCATRCDESAEESIMT